jgi:hypothetical protein
MPSDDDSVYAKQIKRTPRGEEVPSRVKRTILDGIKNVKLKKASDIWKNKRLS